MKQKNHVIKKKYSRFVLWAVCAVYAAVLIWLLYFNARTRADMTIAEVWRSEGNLIPFRTIAGIFRDWKYGWVSTFDMIWNNLGNLLAFLPLGMALPCLFRRMQRAWRTTPTAALIVTVVEIMQLLTRRGMPDVDDLILNTVGALGGYGIVCIPPFRRLLVRVGWWKTEGGTQAAPVTVNEAGTAAAPVQKEKPPRRQTHPAGHRRS